MTRPIRTPFALLAAGALLTSPLLAQQDILSDQQEAAAQPGMMDSWLEGDGILGDFGGGRTALVDKGVEFFGGYTAEVWGNVDGGTERGAVYTGLLDFGVNLDFDKLVGWQGASFSTTWIWLSGRDVSEDKVGNFLTVSNIAGFNTLRMLEMWFQQDFWQREGGPSGLSIRLGQLTADSEFLISDYGSTFINGTFGWPAFSYTNIPAGGPGYPMGAPGVRVAVTPVEWFTYQAAAFEGDVFDQNVNRHGFRYRLNCKFGYFLINEAQFRWNHKDDEMGLAGQLKLGAWFHTADFANAEGEGSTWGNSYYYAVLDQQLYREPATEVPAKILSKDAKAVTPTSDGTGRMADHKTTAKSFKEPVKLEKSSQGLGWFGRVSFGPQTQNFVGFYFDTGLVYTGLIPGRDDDALGVALGFADLTPGAAQTLFDEGSRKAGYEAVLEVTYDAQITNWLHIQPDLQYIIRPGGTGDYGNALVLGGRVSVTF